ncbi:MAG: hypothetical protein ABFE13_21810 [Phycisphaerales bacterium]
MKRLLREFAEVPGAVLLALLALFNAFVVSDAEWNDIMGRVSYLENEVVQLSAALSQTVSVVDALAYENAPYKGDAALPKTVTADFYEEPTPDGAGHLPWPMAHRVLSRIETWCLAIAIVLFLAGLIYRLASIELIHGRNKVRD